MAKTPKSPRFTTQNVAASKSNSSLNNTLELAIQAHRGGEYIKAQSLYQQILSHSSKHFDALQLLGTLYAQTRSFELAEQYLSKAKKIQPHNVNVLNNLGYAYKELKQYKQSIENFTACIKLNPTYAEAYNNLGNVYKDIQNTKLAIKNYQCSIVLAPQNAQAYYNLSQIFFESNQEILALKGYDYSIQIHEEYLEAWTNKAFVQIHLGLIQEALISCEHALRLNPHHQQALNNKATALQKLGEFQEAIICLDSAIQNAPNQASSYVNRGNVYRQMECLNEALNSFELACSLEPENLVALVNRAVTLKDLKQYAKAMFLYESALCIDPARIEVFFNRANLYKDLCEYALALSDYHKVLSLDPTHAQALNNRGNVWAQLRDTNQSRTDYQLAICLDPTLANGYNNLGVDFHEKMQLELAKSTLERALTLNPHLVDARWNLGLVQLMQGDLKQGFQNFEWRWKNPRLGLVDDPSKLFKPQWRGQEVKGCSLLLYAEQGLGDTLQFARYACTLQDRGAKVTLCVQQELSELFKLAVGVGRVIHGETAFRHALEDCDFVSPLMSLPLYLGTDLKNIPPPSPLCLKVNSERIVQWRARLQSLGINQIMTKSDNQSANKQIGLVFSGRAAHHNDHHRSVALQQLIDFLPIDHQYFIIQKEIRPKDLASLKLIQNNHVLNISDLSPYLNNFTDTAEALLALDGLITVDTSVAHLAGCLGVKTWLLLPFSADWRWLQGSTQSEFKNRTPWYQSLTLCRQSKAGDWESAVSQIKI